MAEIKKYLDTAALGTLVEQIKAEDAKVLKGANDYADSLATNYDAAGAAAGALENAKKYTDELANGAVATNAAAAKKAQDEVDALELVVDTKADAADLATLAGKVGEVPADKTVMGIIANIQENAYNDTELRGLINGLDTNKADKTQVATDIAAAVEGEANARAQAIAGVQGAVDGLASTHATDKKALEDAIALKADQTALEEVSGTLEAVKKDVDDFFADALGDTDAQQVKDTLREIQDYIDSDAEAAATMAGNIQSNTNEITGVKGRLDTAEGAITATEGDIAELQGAVAKKVETETYNAKISELEDADGALDERLQEIEAKFGTGENSVEDMISDAIDAEALRVNAELDKKVDKVAGKGLSTNDLTDELKGQYDAAYAHSQIAHAPDNAQANIIESVKVNGTALTITDKAVDIAVPTDNKQLANGAGYLVANDIANKADKATTLEGYGITDTYTSVQIDEKFAEYQPITEAEINSLFTA